MLGRLPRDAMVAQFLRLLTHSTEVQVDTVVQQADPAASPQFRKERSGHLRTAQQHVVEVVPIVGQPLAEGVGIAAIGDLYTHVLQRIGVAGTVVQVLRPELDHHARLQQAADDAQYRARAGIAIGLRHIVVDHQDDVTLSRAIARTHDMLTVRQMLAR